jgi:hypothetical protein
LVSEFLASGRKQCGVVETTHQSAQIEWKKWKVDERTFVPISMETAIQEQIWWSR